MSQRKNQEVPDFWWWCPWGDWSWGRGGGGVRRDIGLVFSEFSFIGLVNSEIHGLRAQRPLHEHKYQNENKIQREALVKIYLYIVIQRK